MRERVSFPSHTQKEISDLHGQCEAAAVHIFLERCFKDEDQRYLLELMVWTVNFQGNEVHFTPVVLNSGPRYPVQSRFYSKGDLDWLSDTFVLLQVEGSSLVGSACRSWR
ncbi:UNVERIFIED_CONTAM: hypothetical protein FKN15_055057 [Acipenser sinensis]